MNKEQIVLQLKSERDRLDEAISALEGSSRNGIVARKAKRSGGITAAGRKKLSEMMKKRWAERRRTAKKAA